jgi:hypothetical protein
MQLILVTIKWHIKWKYLIKKFHDICLSYYFNWKNMHKYVLYIAFIKKICSPGYIYYCIYKFTKKNMHPYILYITLLKKICTLHAIGIVCGGAYFFNKVIYIYTVYLS